MEKGLKFVGISVIISSLFMVLFAYYAIALIPIVLSLGCIVLGLGKVIELLKRMQ